MEPIKIAGLTLKSETPTIKDREEDAIIDDAGDPAFADAASENPPVPEPISYEYVPTIEEEITTIIKRVEELPNSDTNIKALAKLKGALELLS